MLTSALIFAAPPPPIGGVSSLVLMLLQSMERISSVKFVFPMAKKRGLLGVFRPLINIWFSARGFRSEAW